MKLEEKIAQIQKTSTLKTLQCGKSKDLDQLWKDFIEPLLPDEAAVRQWHRILMDYVNKPDAIFFMRAYGSPSGNSPMLRRGFYNTTDYGFSAFYGDNFFTAYFYSMAYDGFAPKDTAEFEQMMRQRIFPCGFIQTAAEKQYAAYSRGQNPGITTKGYKIAHIYSSGKDFNKAAGYSTIGDFCGDVFPRGINTEWATTSTDAYGTYHYRKVDFSSKEKAEIARKFLVAHFLRTVHPLNYFLVPKEGSIEWTDAFDDKRHEIGEYADLLRYVEHKIREKYSKNDNIYEQFLSLIYPINIFTGTPDNVEINAKFSLDAWKKGSSKLTKATPKKVKTASGAAHTPIIEFIPSNEGVFKEALLEAKKAEIVFEYDDNRIVKKVWDASSFNASSNLKGNIRSRGEYKADKDRIRKITVIV